MVVPVFSFVSYLSPWFPLPPGFNQVGVYAVVIAPSDTGLLLAGRLRQDNTVLQVIVGPTPNQVIIVPAAPLSTALAYAVDVQWVPAGTNPKCINWTTANTVATAPILTSIVTLTDAAIAGSAVSLGWDFGATAVTPAGANITAFNTNGKSVGFARVQGLTGAMTLKPQATPGTLLYLQAVMPIAGGINVGFTEPFTSGPIVTGSPLPLSAPTISAIAFDGGAAQVTWTVPPPPSTGGAVSYELVVSGSGGSTVLAASATGGVAVLGGSQAGAWSVAGRVRIGPTVGASGSAIALVTQVPTLDQIAVAAGAAGVTARVTIPGGAPSGATATVQLIRGGVVMATATKVASGGTADLSASGVTGDGWQLRASLGATVSGATVAGPYSDLVPVLASAPAIADVSMTPNPTVSGGWIVTVRAATPPPAGAALVIALSQGNTQIGSQTIGAADSATFTLTQGTAASGVIDGTNVATASITLITATATSPAGTATFIGAAPTVTSVENNGPNDPNGQAQGVEVWVGTGGQSGQVLAIQLLANGRVFSQGAGTTATSATIPLTQLLDPSVDWTVQARWSGSGVTDATFGGWSAPIAVLTSTTGITTAAYDGSQVTLSVQPPVGIGPAQGTYFYAYADDEAVQSTSVIGTRGSVAFTRGDKTWYAAAKPFQPLPSGGSNQSQAPGSPGVVLLLNAPAFASVSYDGATLSASWNVVNDGAGTPATGALLELANAGGTIATIDAGAGSGQLPAQLAASDQGAVTLRVRAMRATDTTLFSGAYSGTVQPLISMPTPNTIALGGTVAAPTVTAALATPAGVPDGTTYQAWLMAGDKVVSGPVDATTADSVTSVSFAYAALGVTGLSVTAQAQATSSAPTLYGPVSAPVPVLSTAPQIASVVIASPSATQWSIDATWSPPVDGAAITAYTLTLTRNVDGHTIGSAPFGAVSSGGFDIDKSAVDATQAYTLSLVASAANGSTAPTATAAAWFAPGAFTSVTSAVGRILAQWTVPAAMAGTSGLSYLLQLLDTTANNVVATATASGTQGSIDVSALGLASANIYALQLGVQLGPVLFLPDSVTATQPSVLLSAPTGLTVTTDPASGKATLSWTPVANVDGYSLRFSEGTTQTTSGASYTFTAPLAAGSHLEVAVSATVTPTGGPTSTGPASASLTIPTEPPALTAAEYNGATVTASWQSVAGASSYVATVLNGVGTSAGSSPATAGTSVSFAAALTAASGPYTLVVQASTQAGSGLASASLPLFQPAWFVSTEPTSEAPPYVYPAATMALAPAQIAIYLPPLGNGTITVAPVGAFALTANTDPTTLAALPYILTFAANSEVWTFSDGSNPLPAIRPQVQADYVSFLQAAETAGASAYGISILQMAISRWMPQTFAETHYYAYGLDITGGNGTGSIDLRQGLVLRVGFANYTNVWSSDTSSWLNGFGGGSPSDFDVADGLSGSGNWQLSMDAFTAMLTASGSMNVTPPSAFDPTGNAAGVADAADLFFPTFPNPFYRLFFPGTLENPTSTGTTSTVDNFALASASSFTALGSTSSTPSAGSLVAFFRGRAVLRLMIRIRVNDAEIVVPLGTTVGNVLDRYGVRPPATSVQLTGVVLERAGGPGLAVIGAGSPPPAIYDSATRRAVRLDWSTMATYGGPVDATNLPLLHGDRISF
jgi:hypothetical protein